MSSALDRGSASVREATGARDANSAPPPSARKRKRGFTHRGIVSRYFAIKKLRHRCSSNRRAMTLLHAVNRIAKRRRKMSSVFLEFGSALTAGRSVVPTDAEMAQARRGEGWIVVSAADKEGAWRRRALYHRAVSLGQGRHFRDKEGRNLWAFRIVE